MNTSPTVSVVIPTRNRWSLLKDTLACALGQREVELEVVVVDEACTDETPAQLAACPDPRLRVIRNEQPLGVAGARNRGIAAARGEWVALLDDDDLWSPDKLRNQLELAALGGADFVYSAVLALDADRFPLRTYAAPPPSELAERLERINMLPAAASNLIVRRARLVQLGAFDERLHQVADWDLALRLARNTVGAAAAEVHVGYVQHVGSMRTGSEAALRRELEVFSAKHAADGVDPLAYNRGMMARWLGWGYVRAGHRRTAARIYLMSAIRDRTVGNAICAGAALMRSARADRLIMRLTPDAERDPRVPTPAWLVPYQRANGQ
jgi:glycosyltransferase involved in cell wall biosynthesis